MADTKKRKTQSGTKRKVNAGNPRESGNVKQRSSGGSIDETNLMAEIYIWIISAVAILLFLSNFGICGIIGNAISYFMFGLFGVLAYIFPIVLFGSTVFWALGAGVKGHAIRQAAIFVLFADATVFAHMITTGDIAEIVALYSLCGESHSGGGLLGGAIGITMSALIGSVGTYIVGAVIGIIMLVVISQKSIIGSVKNYGDITYEERARLREERQRLREEREMERIERQREEHERELVRRERRENELRQREQRQKELEKGERARRSNKKKIEGIDFDATSIISDTANSTSPGAKVSDVHEIRQQDIVIEGLEPSYSGHVSINEEGTDQYTYIEPSVHGRLKRSGDAEMNGNSFESGVINLHPEIQQEDHSKDGEFTPKERIIVSEEAKKTMRRKPYQYSGLSVGGDSKTDLKESVTSVSGASSADGQAVSPSELKVAKPKKKMRYLRPKPDLLNKNPGYSGGTTKEELMATANKLQQILKQFGVNVTVTNVSKGPSVTRYELQPEMGTKVSKITSLTDDIKLNLAAADIRIEAPIPGKAAVGIEVPNKKRDTVYIRDLIESKELKENKSKIAFAAGKDIAGRVVVADIAKMPHMLVAGTTGSGKSVFTNSIIMSILYRATPDEVKLIIIDPKVVEFGIYNGIPHLMTPVVTDPKKAAGALNWAVAEMSDRYKKFAASGTRDLKGYNEKISAGDFQGDEKPEKLPQIVIIIDELADLMMVAAKDVEDAICRLAQLARAAGIHLIIATQRPSVDVVTGLIKANIPSRVALLVSSGTDSRTIIDSNGAEKLLGNGDMLFYPSGYAKPVRVQGAFVSDEEVQRTVEYLIANSGEVEYNDRLETKMVADMEEGEDSGEDGKDAYFMDAARLVVEKQKGSTSMIQRTFRVGFNRAARIMEQMYEAGIVGAEETNKPRKVLMTLDEFEQKFNG